MLTLRAAFAPSTFNAEKRTIELVWTTGAKGLRRTWGGDYHEELEVSETAVRLARLNNGAPLLAAHDAYSLRGVVGVVERAWIAKGEGRAIVRFSERVEAAEIMRDVAAGILQNISVGYTVYRYEVTKEADSKIETYRAVDWEPMEISIVPIGFDDGAKVRSSGTNKKNKVEIITRGKNKMNDDQIDNIETGDETIEPAAPAARAVLRAERSRTSSILTLCRKGGLGDDFASALIRDGVPLAEARAAIVDEMSHTQRRTQPDTRGHHGEESRTHYAIFGNDYSAPEFRTRAMSEALAHRINPSNKPSEEARQFMGRSLVDLARECLHQANVSTRTMSTSKIIERALGGLHGTSDFTSVLGNAVGRELQRAFESAEAGVVHAARAVTANDFRSRYPVRLGDAPQLLKVNEHGEYKRGTIIEDAQPAWKLDTFGRIFGLTRQAIINDDMGAFSNIPGMFGIAAREFESQQVVTLLTSASGAGPTMGDGSPLFHTANHGNLASSGAAPNVASLGAARTAMRLQKNLEGRVINVVPKFLIVPAALETTAEQLLASINATTVDDVNPFSGKLTLLVDPRLDAASSIRWYLAGDPGRYDGLEIAHLAGSEGPMTETNVGFDVDGVEFKVRLDFGCGFTDYRSFYANPGAAPG